MSGLLLPVDFSSAPTHQAQQAISLAIFPTRKTSATPFALARAIRFTQAYGSQQASSLILASPSSSRTIHPPFSPSTVHESCAVLISIAAASFPLFSSTHPQEQLSTIPSDSPPLSRPTAKTSTTPSMSSILVAFSPATPSGRRVVCFYASIQSSSALAFRSTSTPPLFISRILRAPRA